MLPTTPHARPWCHARRHLPNCKDFDRQHHGHGLQQANNDAQVMQGLTPRNVTECNEICQGARRRRRSGHMTDL